MGRLLGGCSRDSPRSVRSTAAEPYRIGSGQLFAIARTGRFYGWQQSSGLLRERFDHRARVLQSQLYPRKRILHGVRDRAHG